MMQAKRDAKIKASKVYSAMFFTTRRLLSELKTEIHSKIVLVGASTTGISFARYLFMVPYLYMTNLVIISSDGALFEDYSRPVAKFPISVKNLFVETLDFEKNELSCLTNIDSDCILTIRGSLVDIEREQKLAVFEDRRYSPSDSGNTVYSKLSYDYLVLTTGRQYKVPRRVKERIPNGAVCFH